MSTDLGGVPISAPGAASSRTDIQPVRDVPGGQWGDRQDMAAIQGAAPMYAKPAPPRPVSLFAPSSRPDEPITSGVDIGPGIGSSGMGPVGQPNEAPPAPPLAATLRRLSASPAVEPRVAGLLNIIDRLGW